MPFKKVLYIVTQSEWGGAQKYVYDLTESFLKQGIEVGVVAGTEKNDLFNKLAVLESDKLTLFREKHLVRAINPYHDFIEFFSLLKIIWKFQPDVVHLNSSKAGILGTFAAAVYNVWRKFCPLNPPVSPLGKGGREVGFTHDKRGREAGFIPDKGGRKMASSIGKGGRTGIVYTAHGFVFNENLSILIYLFYLWSEKICSLMRDKIIVVSHYDLKSALEKKAVKAEKMVVIHNGIDMGKRNQLLSKVDARGKLKKFAEILQYGSTAPAEAWNNGAAAETAVALESPETQIIGTVANLYENKGLKYLIEAANEVVKDMPNCLFILIGEGELENKLRKIIKDNRLQNNFFMLGKVLDAYKYFNAFDIFCLPSIKEGLSYTLIEALMAGLPIVATNVGGNPEIVKDGVNGFLVQPKDRNGLAEKIKILLKNNEIRERMRTQSWKLADGFSLERMAEQTYKTYMTYNFL